MARDADEVPASGGGDCPQIGPRRATKQGIFKTRQILMSFAPPGITLPTIPQSEISNQNSQRNRKLFQEKRKRPAVFVRLASSRSGKN